MISLYQIEMDLQSALKARNQVAADTLRALKVRIQNEKIAKQTELSEEQMVALVKSEMKRRKEAADSFASGNRPLLAEKELVEAKILEQYLPAQMSEAELNKLIGEAIEENGFSAQDFGKAMGLLKGKVGQNADSAVLAKILKQKLK